MPELGFILTQDEEMRVIRHALSMGTWFVPDIGHETAEPLRIETYAEYEHHRKMTRLFFIAHRSFSTTPLEMRETLRDEHRVYRIKQRNGGPVIDFLSSVEFHEDGKAKINPGFLAFHRTFWNANAQENQVPKPSLVTAYRELCAEVRKIAKREKVGLRTYWIGRGIRQRIGAGELQLGISGIS